MSLPNRCSVLALVSLSLASVSLAGAAGCTVRGTADRDTGGGGGVDAGGGGGLDTGGVNLETGPLNPCSGGCGTEELCGEGDGNGLDDNCNGQVDEGCPCTPGTTRICFQGPPDRRNIGACSDGIEYCSEFGIYEGCGNGNSPAPETCDGVDNDCNAATDDGLSGCTSALTCPGNEIAPPLTNHTLRGSRVYMGAASEWHWGISCPDSVPAELCPRLSAPNSENSDVYLAASGAYRVTLEVVLPDGTRQSCAWTLYVRGGGLRVELNWDTMLDTTGGTDIDLHLHRWTSNSGESAWFGDDDCYYGNCQPDNYSIDWPGHPDSDLSNCSSAPHGGGADWTANGACGNPRLDVDTNGTDGACDGSETNPDLEAFCAPENINIDTPVIGQPYRILVNDYSNSGHSGTTYTTVNVYCGGNLRGSFGRDTEFLDFSGSDGDSFGESNASWIVADVVFFQGECGLDCRIYPIIRKVTGDLFGGLDFGPDWSCDYDAATDSCR